MPYHYFLMMSAATILFLTICATAPLSLPIICGIHLIILPAWWHRNSTTDNTSLRLLTIRVSAIMHGAILHGLFQGCPDMDPIYERVMRRSYGTELATIFQPNIHPYHLQFVDRMDGNRRCRVMKWYARQVYEMEIFV